MITQEKIIKFKSKQHTIEGLFSGKDKDRAVIITHPHSLYGGNMYNPVVEVIHNVYRENGYSTLRFNFRGVGNSTGVFDDGVGEVEDVSAAFNYLKDRGASNIDLAGYSFGAWVNVMFCDNNKNDKINNMVLVSPPVNFIRFKDVKLPALNFVVTGGQDEIAPPEMIKPMMKVWNLKAEFKVIDYADHFYFDSLEKLKNLLENNLTF